MKDLLHMQLDGTSYAGVLSCLSAAERTKFPSNSLDLGKLPRISQHFAVLSKVWKIVCSLRAVGV